MCLYTGLFQALVGATIRVPTLDNKYIPVKLTEVVKPSTVKRVQGEGLPHPKNPSSRGDLILQFDIQFPETLPKSAKDKLADVLPRTNYH